MIASLFSLSTSHFRHARLLVACVVIVTLFLCLEVRYVSKELPDSFFSLHRSNETSKLWQESLNQQSRTSHFLHI